MHEPTTLNRGIVLIYVRTALNLDWWLAHHIAQNLRIIACYEPEAEKALNIASKRLGFTALPNPSRGKRVATRVKGARKALYKALGNFLNSDVTRDIAQDWVIELAQDEYLQNSARLDALFAADLSSKPVTVRWSTRSFDYKNAVTLIEAGADPLNYCNRTTPETYALNRYGRPVKRANEMEFEKDDLACLAPVVADHAVAHCRIDHVPCLTARDLGELGYFAPVSFDQAPYSFDFDKQRIVSTLYSDKTNRVLFENPKKFERDFSLPSLEWSCLTDDGDEPLFLALDESRNALIWSAKADENFNPVILLGNEEFAWLAPSRALSHPAMFADDTARASAYPVRLSYDANDNVEIRSAATGRRYDLPTFKSARRAALNVLESSERSHATFKPKILCDLAAFLGVTPQMLPRITPSPAILWLADFLPAPTADKLRATPLIEFDADLTDLISAANRPTRISA